MKNFTLLLGLFAFTSISFAQHAQLRTPHNHDDQHYIMEHLFEDKSILQLEIDLGLQTIDYENQPLLDYIDERYQQFHSNILHSLGRSNTLTKAEFDALYDQLVQEMQGEIDGIKPGDDLGEPKAADGPCVNMDFETGDLTGWTLTRGNVDGSVPYSYVGEFAVGPGPYHTVFGGGLDPVTGISRVNPLNGTFSTRLGNGTGVGARAARMKQTFLVDPTNYLFTYSYAVIFESPNGHGINRLPYFTVRVIDSLGNSVPCGEYSVIADAANAPDYQSTVWGGSTVLYKDWQHVFTNLSAYIGQNVTIEFTTGDCSLTGHFGYAYIDASCAVDQITASNNIICVGDSAILSAPLGAASYLWSNGDTTQISTVYTGGSYSCTLTPFQGGGCSITLDIDITENPSPTANFSLNTAVVCQGDPVQCTGMSSIPAPGVITGYRWDFGDGTITPISSGAILAIPNTNGTYTLPSHTYTAPGVYNIQLYVESADGCADSISFPVTVNPLPVVVAGIDQSVCEGVAVTLSGAGALSYTWNHGITDGVPFIQGPGTTVYTVTGTDANGCQNTDQVSVIVNTLPNVGAGPDVTICDNIMTSVIGTGASTYVWDNGVINAVPFAQAVGTITYTVTGTDVNGCTNTDQVDITVNPLPIVDAGLDQSICQDDHVTLSGSGALTYAWTAGVIDGVPFAPAVGNYTFTVTGTDANGCTNIDEVNLVVNDLPVVVAGANETACAGGSVTLNGSGAVTYVWDNGVTDGIPFGQGVGTVTYTVIGTDANGCSNSDQVDVTVNALPVVVGGLDQTVCDGEFVTLSGSGAVSYVWDNGVTDGVPFAQGVGTVTYSVIGTDMNGCSNTDNVDVTVNPLPVVDAGVDNTECENTQITLSGAGAMTYTWDTGVIDGVPFTQLPGTVTYTVVGTDANGCTDSDQVDITINALPNVVAGPDQTVCDGTPVTLSGSGANNYAWTGGVVDGVPFVPAVGQYQFVVSGTDVLLCANNDTVLVTVHANPVVIAGIDQTSCEDSWITLNAIGSPNLYWSNAVINNTPFQQGVGIVDYVVYDSLATGCTSSDTVRVEVFANPIVTANDAEICEGEGVTLSGQGAVSYSWTGGVINGVEFYPTTSGNYDVLGISADGCTAESTASVIVHYAPDVSFKIDDMSLTTLDPTTSFTNLTTGATSYNWDFGDGSPYSSLFEPTHTFPVDASGEYQITLTAYSDFGCVAEAVKYIHVFQDYTIFVPNSFTPDHNGENDIFKPVMTGFDEDDFTLYIFNRWGDLIFESHNMEVGWDGTFAGQDYQVQDGAYTWKIVAGLKDSSDSKIFVGHVVLLK